MALRILFRRTNPTVLNVRPSELREAQIVEHGPDGYGLTPHGKELLGLFLPLHVWAEEWARLFDGSARKRVRSVLIL